MQNDQPKYLLPIPDEALSKTRELLCSGDLFRYDRLEKSEVYELEEKFASAVGSPFALATSSCTSAMFLALKALGLPPGSEVIVPAFTFSAVPSAVLQAGHVPILCEMTDDYRVDLDALRGLLTRKSATCLLISHMRGHLADLDGLQLLAREHGIPLIEDAAHALGATWRGRQAGTIGDIGCFSFQSHKLVNCGEGGMLVTRDANLIARAIIMSGAYEENWLKHPAVGAPFRQWQNRLPTFNVRMSNMAATIAESQIDAIDYRSECGRSAYQIMVERLEQCRGIQLPRPGPVEMRAPDSLQFNMPQLSESSCRILLDGLLQDGYKAQVFGLGRGNARAYWNWQFLADQELPRTRRMLSRAFDLKLPIYSSKVLLRKMASSVAAQIDKANLLSGVA